MIWGMFIEHWMFSLLLLGGTIGTVASLFSEQGIVAFLLLVGTLTVSQFAFGLLAPIINNPNLIWQAALLYLPIGILWSFFEWYRHCIDEMSKIVDLIDEEEERHVRNLERELKRPGEKDTESRNWAIHIVLKSHPMPNPREEWDSIGRWVFYWPIFVLIWAMSDLFKSLAKWIVRAFNSVYVRITLWVTPKYLR